MKRILLFLVIAMLARGGDFRWEEWHGKRIQASRGELRRLFFLKELPVLATARFRTDGELYVNDRPFGPIEGQGYRNLRSALRVGENELLLQLHEGGESSHGVELLLVFADGEQRLVLSDYGWDLQTGDGVWKRVSARSGFVEPMGPVEMPDGFIPSVRFTGRLACKETVLRRQRRLPAELEFQFSQPLALSANRLEIWIVDEEGCRRWRQALFMEDPVDLVAGFQGRLQLSVELCTEYLPKGRYHLELPLYCQGGIDGGFEVEEPCPPRPRPVPEFRGRRGGFRLDDDWVAPVVCCHAPLRAPQRERYFLTDLCRRVAREGNCHLHCVEGPPQASYFGEVAEEILSADPDAVLFLLLDDATPAEAGSLLGTLAEKPYFHRVGGVWFSEKKEDYSLFPQQFRNYLRRKYRTEEALCAAWGEKELLFSEIELPGQYDGDVFNPQDGGWRWIDCNYARHEARREDLDALCRAVKAVSPELLTGGAESLDGELCQLVIDAETPRRHLLRKRLPLARVDHADSAYAGQGVLRTVTKGGGLCHWNLRSPPCLAWEQALLRESRFFSPLEELTASVAHVTDEENGWHGKLGERLRDAWEGSGCLVDEIRLPEVGQPQLPKYRLYFIDDIVAVSPEGRRKIDSLKRDGNVLVFQHATGYSDWSRLSAENISSLVGIELREAEAGPLTWRYADNSHALLAGTVAGGEVQEAAGRRFVVEDRDAVVLGRYLLDGQAAAAVKSHGDWAAVYLPGEAPLEMRDNLVAYAHVHRLADAPAIVRSDGRFLSVEGGKGSFAGELSFLEETALYDVWDGTVTLPSKSVSFQLERGGMRLWFAGSLAEVRAFAKKVRPLSQK